MPEDKENNVLTAPCSVESERLLLGAILLDNRVYQEFSDFLHPDQFYDAANGHVFWACQEIIEYPY